MNNHGNRQRQERYKERKRKEGYTQLTVWVKPEHKDQVKAYAEQLNAKD